MKVEWPWSDLGLDGPSDSREIRRAYAARLKQIDRNNACVFQGLRAAYEAALHQGEGSVSARARPTMRQLIGQASDAGTDAGSKALAPPRRALARPTQNPDPDTDPETELPDPSPGREPQTLEDLYALWRIAPQRAQRHFTARMHAALAQGDFRELRRLSESEIGTDPEVRISTERSILAELAGPAGAPTLEMTPELAQFLDETFGWQRDYVGARNRIGSGPTLDRVLHAAFDTLRKREVALALNTFLLSRLRMVEFLCAALCGLSLDLVVRHGPFDPAEFVFLGIGYIVLRYIAMGVKRVSRRIEAVLWPSPLGKRLDTLANRYIPNLYRRMRHDPAVRVLNRLIVSAALIIGAALILRLR